MRAFSRDINFAITNSVIFSSKMPDNGGEICPGRFAWECEDESCCESYHMRVMMLFFSVGVFLVALIVLIIWLAIDYRPSRR
jgi:hypothetical protein